MFETILGQNDYGFDQTNLRADTRTFLYFEVLQDLRVNKAIFFGKGIDAGYRSDTFQTLNRSNVEVGFLQILLKSGIIGFILYITIIFSAISKAMTESKNLFMKYLGLLLSGYILIFFFENVLYFNLLNIIIWFVVGMCHSEGLRNLTNEDIGKLFRGFKVIKNLNK